MSRFMKLLMHLVVALSLLLCPLSLFSSSSLSFIECQYGFVGSPSDEWYLSQLNAAANPYDTSINATAADENLNAFRSFVLVEKPTVLFLRQSLFSVGNALAGRSYRRFDVNGEGSFWTLVSGVETVLIDLTPLHPDYKGPVTKEQMTARGVTRNENGTISYNITFANQHDGVDIMHNHGQLGGWWSDGVPYLTANPLNSGEEQTYTYTIDPVTNAGTYFLHSHYGYNNIQGMSVPLIIQYPVDAKYPLADKLNNPNITEVLLYLEDFCLVFTNADDANETDTHDDDGLKTFYTITDPYICENPQLAMRAVYGEWNSHKGRMMLQPNGTLHQCLEPTKAPEFGMAHIFANERTYDETRRVPVQPGALVRLRIINGARMTNFLVELPPALNKSVVVAVDGHYVEPVALTSFVTGGVNTSANVWVGVAQRVDVLVTMPKESALYPIYAYTEAPRRGECGGPSCRSYEYSMTAGIILDTTQPDVTTPSTPNDDDDDEGDPSSNTPSSNCITFPAKVSGVGMLSTHPEFLLNQNLAFTPWETERGDLKWTANFREMATNWRTIALTGYNGIFGLDFLPHYQFPPTIPLTTPELLQPTTVAGGKMPLPIRVKFGDKVCFTFVNYNWETHPMHLHGHSFQVVEVNGEWVDGPIRDTVMVPAGKCNNLTICFNANSVGEGTHGLHCHMAIHEMTGMFTMVEYEGKYKPITTVEPSITSIAQASAILVAGNTMELTSFKVTASVFIVFFVVACVVILFLSYKLRQHLYRPAPTEAEVEMHPSSDSS